MLTISNGWQQAWNLQISVDMDSYMILGGHVTQATNDKQQLKPALDQMGLPNKLGTIKRIAADSGYFSRANVEDVIDNRDATPYIATGRQTHYPDWTKRLGVSTFSDELTARIPPNVAFIAEIVYATYFVESASVSICGKESASSCGSLS